MFWPDVLDIKSFYSSMLGRLAARIIKNGLKELIGEIKGERILGVGYCPPYLQPFLEDAESVFCFMPAAQGVIHWPASHANNLSLMGDELELPFPDNSIDIAIVAHACENSEQVIEMLEEIWRVLVAGGKIFIITPNRKGIWSRLDTTPFGQGKPYSRGQLKTIMEKANYVSLDFRSVLYTPPINSTLVMRFSGFFEKIGSKMRGLFGGVLIASGSKQVYAVMPLRKKVRMRRYSYIPIQNPALG